MPLAQNKTCTRSSIRLKRPRKENGKTTNKDFKFSLPQINTQKKKSFEQNIIKKEIDSSFAFL